MATSIDRTKTGPTRRQRKGGAQKHDLWAPDADTVVAGSNPDAVKDVAEKLTGRRFGPLRRVSPDLRLRKASRRRSRRLVAGAGLIAVLVAAFTYAVMFWSVTNRDDYTIIAALCVPAALTILFVPEARSYKVYRWPTAWALGFVSLYPMAVLIAAQTWVIWRYWCVEFKAESPLPARLRYRLRLRPKNRSEA